MLENMTRVEKIWSTSGHKIGAHGVVGRAIIGRPSLWIVKDIWVLRFRLNDVGLHVSRRHQSHGMAKCLQLARPMVRRGASLDANQAWRQLLKERQDVATLQLAADDHLAASVNAVNLEN